MMGATRVPEYRIYNARVRQRRMRFTFALGALTCLLIACSDLFLISQRLAIQNGTGGNLLSIRDVLLGLVFVCSLREIASAKKEYLFGNSLAIVMIVWALYSLILAHVGRTHGNAIRDIVFELIVVWGGLVGIPVLAVVKTESEAKYLGNVFTLLGVLVAVGIFAEVYLRIPIVTGATSKDSINAFSSIVRPVPTGWVFLSSSTAFLLARIAFDSKAGWGKKSLMLAALALELAAGILTETRSIQVTVVVSFLAICYLRRIRGFILGAMLIGLGAAAWTITIAVGTRTIGPQFAPHMEQRYSVFDSRAAGQTYYNEQLRPLQVKALFTGVGSWTILGSGLGDDLASVNLDMPTGGGGTSSDVSLVYLATRFGLIGDLVLAVLALFALRSVSQIRRNACAVSWAHAGFAATLCGLVVASFSSNIWAATYSAIPTSIAYFTVLSLNRRAGRRAIVMVRRPVFLKRVSEGQVQCPS